MIGPDQRTQSRPPVEATWTEAGRRTRKIEDERRRLASSGSTADSIPRGCTQLNAAGSGGGEPGHASGASASVSFGDYLFGVVGLAAVAIPMALAAVRLRRRLLPGWEGAPARLAEAVLGVAAAHVLLQLLGAFGILVPGRPDRRLAAGRPRRLLRRARRFPAA